VETNYQHHINLIQVKSLNVNIRYSFRKILLLRHYILKSVPVTVFTRKITCGL